MDHELLVSNNIPSSILASIFAKGVSQGSILIFPILSIGGLFQLVALEHAT